MVIKNGKELKNVEGLNGTVDPIVRHLNNMEKMPVIVETFVAYGEPALHVYEGDKEKKKGYKFIKVKTEGVSGLNRIIKTAKSDVDFILSHDYNELEKQYILGFVPKED